MTALRNRLHRQVKKILCSVFISVALVQAYGQNNNLTIQFNHILFNDLADTIERLVPVKIYYSDKWVDSLYLSVNSKNTPFEELFEKVFSKEGLNFIITDNNKVILSKGFKIKDYFSERVSGIPEK